MSIINFNENEKAARAHAAKVSLANNPNFLVFLEELRQAKDIAVRDMVTDASIEKINVILAAAGSVRTYLDILEDFENITKDLEQSSLDEEKQS